MKKRILMSKGTSIVLIVEGIISALFIYCIAGTEYASFKEAFRDPRIVIVLALISFLPFAGACLHYVVTDEGIKLVFKKMIKFEDIIEIGVSYGGKYDKNPAPKIAYIKHRTDKEFEKYTFLDDSPKELYAYLSANYTLNFVESVIDKKRRTEIEHKRGTGRKKTVRVSDDISFVLGIVCLPFIIFFLIKEKVWQWHIIMKIQVIGFMVFLGIQFRSLFGLFMTKNCQVVFDENYVYVKFPFHRQTAYRWDEFQQVCICYQYPPKGGIVLDILICFVKKGVKKKAISQRWPLDFGFKYKELPCIVYSEENLEEVKKYCPHTIVDLRGTNGYSH